MYQSSRGHIAQLYELLHGMEKDAGLSELSDVERRVIYAMERIAISTGQAVVRSEQLKTHPLLAGITHPTFYRALKSLRERKIISPAPKTKSGAYLLVD